MDERCGRLGSCLSIGFRLFPTGPSEVARRGEGALPAVGAETSWVEDEETSRGAVATEISLQEAVGVAATLPPGAEGVESLCPVDGGAETSYPVEAEGVSPREAAASSPQGAAGTSRRGAVATSLRGAAVAATSHPEGGETFPRGDVETLHRGVVSGPVVFRGCCLLSWCVAEYGRVSVLWPSQSVREEIPFVSNNVFSLHGLT